MSRAGFVHETEWADAVLEDVGERQTAARWGRCRSQDLIQRVFVLQAVDLTHAVVVTLFVPRVVECRPEAQSLSVMFSLSQ